MSEGGGPDVPWWAAVVFVLTGCVSPSATTVFDQYGRGVSIVDTGVDPAGGTRLTTIGQFDKAGHYEVLSASNGPGTVQTVLPSVLSGAAFVGGMNLLRPAEFNNQTSVNATNSGITAAANPATKVSAAGGTNSGGTATGGTASGASPTAIGGAGGQGGGATSQANPLLTNTSSPTATANPTAVNSPSINNQSKSVPMFAPVFTPVVNSTGGSAIGGTGGSATGGAGGSISCQGNCQ